MGEVEFLEKSFKSPRHEAPRARIPQMVGKAVHESLCKQGMGPELARQAAREAEKKTDFLIVLVRDLRKEVEFECTLNEPNIVLLYEKLMRMLEQYDQCDKFEPKMWEMWRALLILRLSSMWQLRQTIEAISEKYFDNQPLLFTEQTSKLDDQIHKLEELRRATTV